VIVSRRVLADKAYGTLRRMIQSGKLRPGSRIVEDTLAARLGISRIPLRESLSRLEAEGLVRSIPNSASYVADFSTADILEIYTLRLALEPLAARLATLRNGPRLAKQLERLCKQMAVCTKAKDVLKRDRLDHQFHFAIIRASRHTRLIRAYECSHIEVLDLGMARGLPGLRPSEVARALDHESIQRCVAAGDAAGAERAARRHIRIAMQNVEKKLGARFEEML
jgi:DNA-binding GntR family transcriptional regulator